MVILESEMFLGGQKVKDNENFEWNRKYVNEKPIPTYFTKFIDLQGLRIYRYYLNELNISSKI